MTKASGVGERRKGRGELRREMIYMGEGAGGGPFAG